MNKVPMTAQGAEALRVELKDLKNVQRPKVIDAISTAREHGDLKENAEYHAAREQQGFIEGRIQELEGILSNAQVIDPMSLNAGDKIVFGAIVELLNIDTEEEVAYQIVGEYEADISQNKVSVTSPIARAMIGKRVDEEVEVDAPGGRIDYEILSVRYE